MNKKLLMFGLIGVFSVMLVSAVLVTYFSQVEQTIDVESPITIEGNFPADIEGNATEVVIGDAITITNRLGKPIDVTISGDDGDNGIDVSYLSELVLAKKNSEWVSTGDEVTIMYTKLGEEFTYTNVPEDYTLIYYKDSEVGLDGRLDNPEPAIEIVSNIGNLPKEDDANLDADYSEAPDYYEHKTGAKIWAVPTDTISEGNTLDWNRMNEFYYETDLITSTNGDTVTLDAYETIIIYPRYDIGRYTQGEIPVVTTIA